MSGLKRAHGSTSRPEAACRQVPPRPQGDKPGNCGISLHTHIAQVEISLSSPGERGCWKTSGAIGMPAARTLPGPAGTVARECRVLVCFAGSRRLSERFCPAPFGSSSRGPQEGSSVPLVLGELGCPSPEGSEQRPCPAVAVTLSRGFLGTGLRGFLVLLVPTSRSIAKRSKG